MNTVFITTLALITSLTVASTVPHIGNCSEAFFFVEDHIPGTKFTCATNQTWECKVINIVFPACSKYEKCKSFKCQHRPRSDFLESSMNITVDESKWLLKQIKVPNLIKKPVLLYRATRDGWLIADYHSKVDGYTNIYVFMKFKETQRRAAGFTTIDQSIYGGWVNDKQSFVLSIDKRIVATGNQNERLLYVLHQFGPYFAAGYHQDVLRADRGERIDQGGAICGLSNEYMPYEDDLLCSLSGLQNGYYEIDELEVWHIL
ncbi:hypothetical protein FGO68_gene986 [Halteria grandinella]|uniref:TLDc domain-containing protein n=1 Tax=Halteria grandinella TaxID=5974 RepID=A0A8J8NK39_HALGN|nr:hypothetical protein FGO68_gene986 [Halteria grandinella]